MISWERKTKIPIGGGRYNSVCRPNLVGNSSMDLPCGASALLHREYGRGEGRGEGVIHALSREWGKEDYRRKMEFWTCLSLIVWVGKMVWCLKKE